MTIADFSPLTRRIVAAGLLVLLLLSTLFFVIMPLAGAIGEARQGLASARERVARLEALDRRPRVERGQIIPPARKLTAASTAAATAMLVGAINAAAGRTGVPASVTPVASPASADGGLVRVQIQATALEAAMLAFIGDLEHGVPRVVLSDWRLQRGDDASPQLTFTATVTAAWSPA